MEQLCYSRLKNKWDSPVTIQLTEVLGLIIRTLRIVEACRFFFSLVLSVVESEPLDSKGYLGVFFMSGFWFKLLYKGLPPPKPMFSTAKADILSLWDPGSPCGGFSGRQGGRGVIWMGVEINWPAEEKAWGPCNLSWQNQDGQQKFWLVFTQTKSTWKCKGGTENIMGRVNVFPRINYLHKW